VSRADDQGSWALVKDSTPLSLPFPDELLERIAERAADLLEERQRPPAPEMLSVGETADLLRCKPQRIYDLVSQHRLPCLRDGSRLLFRRDDVREYLEGAA